MKLRAITAAGLVLALLSAPAARAEITSFSASVQAEVSESIAGDAGDKDRASEQYPGTSLELPIHAFARLVNEYERVEGVGLAAGMFSDPRTASGANPEELALNLALNSLDSDVSYTGRVLIEETREVIFRPGELPFASEGDRVELLGQVALDGVLLLFAVDDNADLTGALAELEFTVTQSDAANDNLVLTRGTVTLSGQADGQAQVSAAGAMPANRLLRTNLAAVISDFGTFHTVIIPALSIPYHYSVVVGEPLELTVRVVARGRNLSGSDGAVVVLGSPMQRIQEVIDLVNGRPVGQKTVAAVQAARRQRGGVPLESDLSFQPLLPACGMLSLESVLGVVALAGLSGCRSRRAR